MNGRMSDEMERKHLCPLKVLFQHLPKGTEEYHEKALTTVKVAGDWLTFKQSSA
jgi:hypothetical protein